MIITINLTDDELHLIESYAKVHGISVEQVIKSSTLKLLKMSMTQSSQKRHIMNF